jgi:multidrug efflux pump subunit AcrA (membrane-fusion protein)
LEDAKLTDWITALSTVCIMAVAIVAAVISFYQWHEMHTGGTDTHSLAEAAKAQAEANRQEAIAMKNLSDRALQQAQATDKLAEQAEKSANAAAKSAKDADVSASATKSMASTAADSLAAVRQNEALDQRAWIAVTSMRLTSFKSGETIQSQVMFENSGRSPALDVNVRHETVILDRGLSPLFLAVWDKSVLDAVRALAPQVSNTSSKETTWILKSSDNDDVEHFSKTVWVWGSIEYRDAFGNNHSTHFCGYTENNGARSAKVTEGMELHICPQNNTMD